MLSSLILPMLILVAGYKTTFPFLNSQNLNIVILPTFFFPHKEKKFVGGVHLLSLLTFCAAWGVPACVRTINMLI